MADLNEIFGNLPDFDVLSGGSAPAQYSPEKPQKRGDDYGDGFAYYTERKTVMSNFVSLFFFPVLIFWLEVVFRLSVGESVVSIGVLYTFLFSMPAGAVLTLLCTLGHDKFNRALCVVFALIITLYYIGQTLYCSTSGTLAVFSQSVQPVKFERILNTLSHKWGYCLAAVVPFLFNLFFGKRIFRFKRLRITAKLVLIIAAAAIQLATGFAAKSGQSSALYTRLSVNASTQEQFGLFTAQRLDIQRMFFGK